MSSLQLQKPQPPKTPLAPAPPHASPASLPHEYYVGLGDRAGAKMCPIRLRPCLGPECAWWIEIEGRCAITSIAISLLAIHKNLLELEEGEESLHIRVSYDEGNPNRA